MNYSEFSREKLEYIGKYLNRNMPKNLPYGLEYLNKVADMEEKAAKKFDKLSTKENIKKD